MLKAPGHACDRKRLQRAVRGNLLILLLAGSVPGFAAGSLEPASRVDPGQVSDTVSGADSTPFDNSTASPLPASLSADGRYAVFISRLTNGVAGQRDGKPGSYFAKDVFLADLVSGSITLVSHSLDAPATTGNQGSSEAVISADGRSVAFISAATDLVPGQQGDPYYADYDILLYDRATGTTSLVAATRDELTGFEDLAISADGRYLAFSSGATDLVPGQQGNRASINVYLYDRSDRSTRLVSHVSGSPTSSGEGGSHTLGISDDGRLVLFWSNAFLLPGQLQTDNLFLYDRVTDSLALVSPGREAVMSKDGRYVLFGGGGGLSLYARETGVTTLVSDAARSGDFFGTTLSYALSADGRFAAFLQADPATGPYGLKLAVYDRVSGTTVTAGAPGVTGTSVEALGISDDGRFAVFATPQADSRPGQSDANVARDVFLFERTSGKITLVSGAGATSTKTGNGHSYAPALSANGARVAFFSRATDLVPGVRDLNQGEDLFAWDRTTGDLRAITLRAPALPSLTPAAGSGAGALSADGRYVAFESASPWIVAGQSDTNGATDVFLYDRARKATLLVSHVPASAVTAASGPSHGPEISADGRFVAFFSKARNLVPGANPAARESLFLFDRDTGKVSLAARVDQASNLRMSADGRWLVFTSPASDVVPGQQDTDPNSFPTYDVFLWDRTTGARTLVSHSITGPSQTGNSPSSSPEISADGRFVAFVSSATDLVPGQTGEGLSTNVFLWDRQTGGTVLVSHAPGAATAAVTGSAPALSADGRFLAFFSAAGNLDPASVEPGGYGVHLYLYDRALGTFRRIGSSFLGTTPTLSADGRFTAFASSFSLVPGINTFSDAQIYLYDRTDRSISLVTWPGRAGIYAGDGDSWFPTISADGRYLAFRSSARDLVPGQTEVPDHHGYDAFLFDRISGVTTLLSAAKGSPATAVGETEALRISASGRQVSFTSFYDIAEGDFNHQPDTVVFSLDPPPSGGPVTVPPCNLFSGPLRSNARKVLKAAGSCGVPAGAKQVAIKLTVSQGTGKGNVQLYPGNVTGTAAGILRFDRGAARAASFTISLATNGTGTIALLPNVSGNGTVRVMVEVNGYVP